MNIRQIKFEDETIQTIKEIKRLMLMEWLRHRNEVDRIIENVRSASLGSSQRNIAAKT